MLDNIAPDVSLVLKLEIKFAHFTKNDAQMTRPCVVSHSPTGLPKSPIWRRAGDGVRELALVLLRRRYHETMLEC